MSKSTSIVKRFLLCPFLLSMVYLTAIKASSIEVSPSQSVNEIIQGATVGDTILLLPGRFHQSIVIDKAIVLKAMEPGQSIIDGGIDQTFEWTLNENNEWVAEIPWNPRHIVIGPLSIVRMGTNLKNYTFKPFLGGFYYSEGKVYARLGNDSINPNEVHVSIQREIGANIGITVEADSVTVEGLFIQCHSNVGIQVLDQNAFTARDNYIFGSRFGINMEDKNGNGHLIEYNEVSNYPLFQRTKHNYRLMELMYHNAKDGGVFDSETTSFRIGSLSSVVRNNMCHELMDGMQPRKMLPSDSTQQTVVYNNFVWNSRDDGVEFDSNDPQNLRFYNNVIMNGTAVIAPSPVQDGPTIIDHNLILCIPYNQGGIQEKHTMFKFDAKTSWTDGYIKNLRIIHNTVVSTNVHTTLWWTQPQVGGINNMVANNIIDIKNELTRAFPSSLPEMNNFRSNSVGFQNRDSLWDLRLTAESGALNFGSDLHADFHEYSDENPDAGAIEFGSEWVFERVGPRWANYQNVPRPGLPIVINPEMVGLIPDDVRYYVHPSPPVGVNEKVISKPISFYPNPLSSRSSVLNFNQAVHGNVEIYNVSGSLVFKGHCNNDNTLDIHPLKQGVYLIVLEDLITNKTLKLLVN